MVCLFVLLVCFDFKNMENVALKDLLCTHQVK